MRDGAAVFSLVSLDGDQCYPGEMRVSVTYTFKGGVLGIETRAVSDRDTVFSPTTHCYFNLEGQNSGPVSAQKLQIAAHSVLASGGGAGDEKLMPVEGTAFSFLAPRAIADGLSSPHENMLDTMGFDHCYALDGMGFREAAVLSSRVSGIAMRVFTDMPGLVVYTANQLVPFTGRDGAGYAPYCAVCLEPEFFPNALKHPDWEQPLLRAGREFVSRTEYRFVNF